MKHPSRGSTKGRQEIILAVLPFKERVSLARFLRVTFLEKESVPCEILAGYSRLVLWESDMRALAELLTGGSFLPEGF